LKKGYYAIALALAIAISSSVLYYCFVPRIMPETKTLDVEIVYSPKYDLVQFQDELYTRRSVMHVNNGTDQQSIQLREGDSVVLKLLDYPSNLTKEWYADFNSLNYHYVFLNGGGEQGDIASSRVSSVDPLRFVVPKDGYYTFEIGVVNVNAYSSGRSAGLWAFNVTVN
jgi:hypothetical protein